jgi:hypothetical protein
MRTKMACVVASLLVMQVSAVADVLVLRDGRRVEGTLVAVRGETIEFEPRDARVRRFERSDVRSIQFDETWSSYQNDQHPRAAMRERSVTVDARTQWVDSGVVVRAGQEVMFVATGQVRWGPNRRDGASGERNSPFNAGRPMPDRNAAALIGRIGENGDPFFIGDDQQPIRVRGGGRLFLGINDDYLQDNSGSLRVVVAY